MIPKSLFHFVTHFYLFVYLGLFITVRNIEAQTTGLAGDNGIIKIKLDLTRGGAICYLSPSNSDTNLINIHDEGRYIQQSYYAGQRLDRKAEGQAPRWSPWNWNPIQVGDDYGNKAAILDHWQRKDTLYVKCRPMLWDMNNQPAEAEIEQWTVLHRNILEVYNKLTCHRTDTLFAENILNDQELPAVYPISALSNLRTYIGKKPFHNDSVAKPDVVNLSSGFWGRYEDVSEHWMAFVNNKEWGIGVYNPQCTYFLAGMFGKPGEYTHDSSTVYISPVHKEILNKNSVFEYRYYVVVGTLNEIRSEVYKLNRRLYMKNKN